VAEGETPSLTIMGSKYKKKFEREWEGKPISDMKIKTIQIQADKNISNICTGRCKRKRRSK